LCERAGIPVPDVNVLIAGVLVDAVWREQRVVVELDGRNNHSSWGQIQNDRSKELILRAAGFTVVRYGTRQLEEEPALVIADLLRALALPR
jgi:very-short-patch-repair endonuclease